MKLRQDQLQDHLNKGLANCYLVSGDDPLLVMEACDAIRAKARQQGIEERQLFHAEAGFDWIALREEANAMSLFASRRVLEVRVGNGKPSDKGASLQALAEHPNPDNLLLVVMPRLDAKTQRTSWFKALDQAGVFLPIWPIERAQYSGWLQRRLHAAGLHADPGALAALAQQTEGNLLAAVQEIEKLRLLGTTQITEETIIDAIGDSSRFDAFGLADACLEGNLAHSCRMLAHLHSEGVDAIMIVGALNRKIRQLISLHGQSGQQLSAAFKQQNVWPRQQGPYKKALQRLTLRQLYDALRLSNKTDSAIKGSGDDPWLLLSELVSLLCIGVVVGS